MSNQIDLYAQLRELRKKILAMIKNLPDIALANISPETFWVRQFLGRNRLGVGTYNANIYLADKDGNKIDGVVPSLNAPTKILTDEDVGRVTEEMIKRDIRLHVQYGTEDLWITLWHYGVTKIIVDTISDIVYNAYPVDYQPDSPLKIECAGTVYWYDDIDRGFDITMVVGVVGYYSGGKIIQWNGVAISLGVNSDAQKTKIITPRGYIVANPGEQHIAVFSPVWSIYAKSCVVQLIPIE